MSDRQSAPKQSASFWLEAPVQPKRTAEIASTETARALIRPGFLVHARMLTMREDSKRNFFALDQIGRKRSVILDRLVQESACKDEAILRIVRSDAVLALAEFTYAIHVLGLTGPDDSLVLLDLHNVRAAALAKRGDAHALDAPFTDFELLHFEEIWRASPGSLEQAMLARFLGHAMPKESVEPLMTACEAAGFVSRKAVHHARTVFSTGVIESVLAECLPEIGLRAEGH
ncbi:MAG: hypothetical protein ABSC72_08310 [Methylovirgula sp.]|jgi:hypothetical protein